MEPIDPKIAVLGEALCASRRKLKITQAEVAKRMGLRQSYISLIEGGLIEYGTEKLLAYMEAIGGATLRMRITDESLKDGQERTYSSFTMVPHNVQIGAICTTSADIKIKRRGNFIEQDITQVNIGNA